MSVSNLNRSDLRETFHIQNVKQCCLAQAQHVIQKISDIFILIRYFVQYIVYALTATDRTTANRVFKGNVLCSTANFAKLGDLPEFVRFQRDPLKISEALINRSQDAGFTVKQNHFRPKPFTDGHCFGNVSFFLQKWKETQNISTLIENFKGGSPIQGATYQQAYEQFYESYYYPELAQCIHTVLTTYPLVSFAQERKKWLESPFNPVVSLLDATAAYLKEGHSPYQEGFTVYIKNWILLNANKYLCGKALATLQNVEEQCVKNDLINQTQISMAYARIGLSIEKNLVTADTPATLLRNFSTLESGMYHVSLPRFDAWGQLGGHHALGLIIDREMCYILDSNLAIGWTQRKNLTQTMGRLFTEYTGFDYSEIIEGSPPSWMDQIFNLCTERANPSTSFTGMDCSLSKVC